MVTIQCQGATVAEGGVASVCLDLTLPAGASELGCEVTATLSTTNGPRAGL